MAYSAYCDTATHTKWWITGTGSAINRLSEVMDDNASGVEEDDNPGNYQPWSEFMTEVVEDGIYQIHQEFDIGDGSTSTTLGSPSETVLFDSGKSPQVTANATLTIGESSGSYSKSGSYWAFDGSFTARDFITGGILGIYASVIRFFGSSGLYFDGGTITIRNSVLEGWDTSSNSRIIFSSSCTSITISDTIAETLYYFGFRKAATLSNVILENVNYGWNVNLVSLTISNPSVGTTTSADYYMEGAFTMNIVDPSAAITSPVISDASGEIHEQYTVNIHVSDKDGNDLGTVNIDCDSDAEGDAFDVDTDGNGDIAEQTIDYKKWVGTAETLTSYSPHTFTISKTGYETLILENITVDGPINWHLELQDETNRMITHPGMSGGARG